MTTFEPCRFCSDTSPMPTEFLPSGTHDGYAAVVCRNCGAQGPAEWNIENAIKAWNRPFDDSAPAKTDGNGARC